MDPIFLATTASTAASISAKYGGRKLWKTPSTPMGCGIWFRVLVGRFEMKAKALADRCAAHGDQARHTAEDPAAETHRLGG